MGNAIHASVMCHILVSAMVTRGYVTRDSHLIQSQPWTMDLDGPVTPMLDAMLAQSKQWVQQSGAPRKAAHSGEGATGERNPGAASKGRAAGAGKVIKVIEKKNKKESESRRMMRWAKGVKTQEGVQD